MIFLRVAAFILGLALAGGTVFSAVQTFVLPRSAPDALTRLVFISLRRVFMLVLRFARTYETRDRVMAFYAPLALLALLPTWLTLVTIGYSGIYWALGASSWFEAFRDSGSSLLTLGYASFARPFQTFFEFTEAVIGLMLVALLIAYLPSMYSAFSRRESAVSLLEVRAGNPPSAIEMIIRYHRIHGLDKLNQMWLSWETWFAEVQESHTSLGALVFFRSPQPQHSWVNAAGAVLDAAALTRSSLDIPPDPSADLCIRGGFLCLRSIANFFRISHPDDPHFPADPITITFQEFEAALDRLAAQGVPLKADRQQAWQDFAGWRVNYDRVLTSLADLTMAPPSPWTGGRTQDYQPPFFPPPRRGN